LGVIPISVKAK